MLGRARRDLAPQPHELGERLVRVGARPASSISTMQAKSSGLRRGPGSGTTAGKSGAVSSVCASTRNSSSSTPIDHGAESTEAHLPRMPCTGRPAASHA